YEDGDLEHMTEEEVRGVVVALADPAERVMTVTGASEEAAVLKRPAAKALEVVAEEDVEMGVLSSKMWLNGTGPSEGQGEGRRSGGARRGGASRRACCAEEACSC
ncbi:unnamed protein product, partial [Durusdinium trenchii]